MTQPAARRPCRPAALSLRGNLPRGPRWKCPLRAWGWRHAPAIHRESAGPGPHPRDSGFPVLLLHPHAADGVPLPRPHPRRLTQGHSVLWGGCARGQRDSSGTPCGTRSLRAGVGSEFRPCPTQPASEKLGLGNALSRQGGGRCQVSGCRLLLRGPCRVFAADPGAEGVGQRPVKLLVLPSVWGGGLNECEHV